jgi:hypothetical protein
LRVFLASCIAAAAIAVAAVFVLNAIQKPAEVAFFTQGVRI